MFPSTINHAYDSALNVLRANVTPIGFSASPEKAQNYFSVWARDHSICSIAAVLSGEPDLIKTAKDGLLKLLRHQIDHGQVPSYIEIENSKKVYGGLGSITSVDSNMWIVIATALIYKKTKDKRFLNKTNLLRYRRFYRLFKAFDSNDCGLMEVPTAGDWADILDRSYHVLYDQCLYYESLKSLTYLFSEGLLVVNGEDVKKKLRKRIRWIKKRKPFVKRRINSVFWFTKDKMPSIMDEYMIFKKIEPEDYSYYQSHLMPFKLNWNKRFDTFGNVLAIATNVANKSQKRSIVKYVFDNNINKPYPIKSLHPPIYRKHLDWEPIYEQKEKPNTYHNGGIWPVIAGFWVHALTKVRSNATARSELLSFAKLLERENWTFNEHMHGKTGKPLGKLQQAWSAAGYVIAYHSVKGRIAIF